MKRIESIEIHNVKGIKQKRFELNLIPNKPSLLVAPNGFGKTSIAIAFHLLTAGGIRLDKDYCYFNNEGNEPRLIVTCIEDDNSVLTSNADKGHNTIRDYFDIFVINSRLTARATKLKIRGTTIASPYLENIIPGKLIDKVPEKAKFKYTHAKAKARFGRNGKVVPNATT